MLAREKIIASSESSIAVFLEKWFGGKLRLTCGERSVSHDEETDRLMPESIAPSGPKVFFGDSGSGDRKQPSKEEQGQLKDFFCMSKYTHYQLKGDIVWNSKELPVFGATSVLSVSNTSYNCRAHKTL